MKKLTLILVFLTFTLSLDIASDLNLPGPKASPVQWSPSTEMIKIISGKKLTHNRKRMKLILQYRPSLWKEGHSNELRMGDFFVMGYEPNKEMDPDLPDWEIKPSHPASGTKSIFWFRGLEQTISTTIIHTPILICDNHNYALAFILELVKKGILQRRNNKMLHVDQHGDLEEDRFFNPKRYSAFYMTKGKKLKYLLEFSTVANWQHPLFQSGIIDERQWSHLRLLDNGEWTLQKKVASDVIDSEKEALTNCDIIDIDIDVLYPADKLLSMEEKRAVEGGTIPRQIQRPLNKIASLMKNAKAITVASSPGYINQSRALVYIKELLKKFEDIKTESFKDLE